VTSHLGAEAAGRLREEALTHQAAGPAGAVEALAAWRRLVQGGVQDYEALWRASGAAAAVYAAHPGVSDLRAELAREARAYAERAVELRPGGVEGRFARAVAFGLVAESTTLEVVPMRIAEEGESVVALDPTYEHAGSHRLLGLYYLRAPDLVGGDLDAGLRHLREAVRIAPGFAENRLALAEALLADGKRVEALKEIVRARELGLDPRAEARAAAFARMAGG
ncbi:MAG: TRAP transporter TatT component family protein, partial [Planctomycetales bacterium]|nr:TRAP transporter TatT component family protein [Planctomycetales bacterium]